jgi:Xaa-Pro dipeptidase
MLLRRFRSGPEASAFDWDRIDALTPLGGVRVEDNVLVTGHGPRNLTREQLAD